MKLKNLAIAALCTLALSACSSTEDSPIVKTSKQNLALMNRLSFVNDSLKSQYISRGLVDLGDTPNLANERWTSVVIADAGGGLIGGKVGGFWGPHGAMVGAILIGVVCSIDEYTKLNEDWYTTSTKSNLANFVIEAKASGEFYDPEFMYKASILSTKTLDRSTLPGKRPNIICNDSLFASAEKIGIKHNEIIEMAYAGVNIEAVRQVKITNNEELAILRSSEFKAEYKKTIEDIEAGKLSIDNETQVARILKLYEEAIKATPSKTQDISFIVNIYLKEIVESSELTEQERKEIYTALAVGAYSGVLWNDKIDGLQ